MAKREHLSERRTDAENPARDSAHLNARDAVQALPLTPRQVQVLQCVERFVAVHGFPPSLRDLGLMLDMTSLHGITEHLTALVRKGYLVREAGERRAMKVLAPSAGAPVMEPRPIRKALCAHCKKRRVA